MIRRSAAAMLFAVAFAAPALQSQTPDLTKLEVRSEKVAGNVWLLSTTFGGNIAVSVGDDGILLVDDLFEPVAPKIEAALAALSPKPVRFVINTHWHGDHTHGNKAFGKKATILAHDNSRRRMAETTFFEYQPGTTAPRHALPILTFDSKVTLHMNGEEIRGIHLPAGHTDGDTAVYFTGSKVVHMGDDFFHGMFPYIDLSSGGNLGGYIVAVDEALAQIPDDAKVIPGHGPLGTKADLVAWVGMLKETAAVVTKGIAEGKTLEQLRDAKVLAAWDRYSWDFVTTDIYLELAYKSLGGTK